MSKTGIDAAEALASIEDSVRRTRLALGYESGAPFLIGWGVIYMVCYGVGWAFSHHDAIRFWNWLAPLGGVASGLWFAFATRRRDPVGINIGGIFCALALFGVYWAHQRDWVGYEQAATYWTTLWMFGYVIIGLIYGRFYLWLGLAVTLVTIAVCQIGGVVFDAVMTLLVGGGMVASGVYLRWWFR